MSKTTLEDASNLVETQFGIGDPDGLWALSISEQLYELNTQVLILTGLMVLFIIVSIVKPYVLHKISQKIKSKKRSES